MGVQTRAQDLRDLWAEMPADERAVCRARLPRDGNPLTVRVTSVEPTAEGGVMVRGDELSGPLAHFAGVPTAEGGVVLPTRAFHLDPFDPLELLDLDEPNDPDPPDEAPPRPPADPDVPPEFIDRRPPEPPGDVHGAMVAVDGGATLFVPDKIEMHVDDPDETRDDFMNALEAAMRAPLDPTVPPRASMPSPMRRPAELSSLQVPLEEWASSSPLKLPRDVLERLTQKAKQRMIGRPLLTAVLIEKGLNAMDRDADL